MEAKVKLSKTWLSSFDILDNFCYPFLQVRQHAYCSLITFYLQSIKSIYLSGIQAPYPLALILDDSVFYAGY